MGRGWLIGLAAVVLIAVVGVTAWEWRSRNAAVPAPGTPPQAETAPAPAAPSGAPSFDVVRVNPQGEAVIAGRASPGAEVRVLDGDREIGRVTADRNGEWVLVPKEPLPPGSHQLTLSARGKDGATSKSEGVVAMLVPERKAAPGAAPSDSVAVLLPRTGEGATRALQLPAGRKFSLDIIEYDAAGKVQMLGRAVPGARIEIYLDDRLSGRGSADAAGAWSVTLDRSVPQGHYRLRLEALGKSGQSLGRLALKFDRVAPPEGYAAFDVQPGNNLWRLAERSFGEGQRYTEIFQANQGKIRDPNLIYPGQVFAVPTAR
ncbi:MAG TPA: Ig-like domain-containing protein [Stellaceae bacterium]|nr:Ig-like domain-containing protein [Stellaceae bacterium]